MELQKSQYNEVYVWFYPYNLVLFHLNLTR